MAVQPEENSGCLLEGGEHVGKSVLSIEEDKRCRIQSPETWRKGETESGAPFRVVKALTNHRRPTTICTKIFAHGCCGLGVQSLRNHIIKQKN